MKAYTGANANLNDFAVSAFLIGGSDMVKMIKCKASDCDVHFAFLPDMPTREYCSDRCRFRVNKQKKYSALAEQGLCRKCKKRNDREGHAYCSECQEYFRQRYLAKKNQKIEREEDVVVIPQTTTEVIIPNAPKIAPRIVSSKDKKKRSIGQRVKGVQSKKALHEVVNIWTKEWEGDMKKTLNSLDAAIRHRNWDKAERASKQLHAINQKKFEALPNILASLLSKSNE